jgi:acetyltransferase-like isoleucine patch superfamily enzyme
MIRKSVSFIFGLIIHIAYFVYGAEALNTLFLFLPARLMGPTLRRYGAIVGEESTISTPIIFHNTSDAPGQHYANLNISSGVWVGKDVFLDLADKITIEKNATVSMRVTILTHVHAGHSPLSKTRLPKRYSPVILRSGCYIGAGAILLPGVEVGEEAIVAAGALVNRNVYPGDTVAGVPAKSIAKKVD